MQARGLTEGDGWPSVFEEALAARWNQPPTAPPQHTIQENSMSSSVPQKVTASVIQNLTHLTSTFKSKSVGNIIQNIQLAASCLSVMTVVSGSDIDILAKLNVYYRVSSIPKWIKTSRRNWMNV